MSVKSSIETSTDPQKSQATLLDWSVLTKLMGGFLLVDTFVRARAAATRKPSGCARNSFWVKARCELPFGEQRGAIRCSPPL